MLCFKCKAGRYAFLLYTEVFYATDDKWSERQKKLNPFLKLCHKTLMLHTSAIFISVQEYIHYLCNVIKKWIPTYDDNGNNEKRNYKFKTLSTN